MPRKIVEKFEIVEYPQEDLREEQYFIMYTTSEVEMFNPEKVFGVWGADQVSHIMSRFRQTGILFKPAEHGIWRLPFLNRVAYDIIDDAVGVYVLRTEAVLQKVPHYYEVSEREAEEYAAQQQQVRENIERYKGDPE